MTIHGAKNSALPILAAALLTKQSVIHNCPDLSDVKAAIAILEHLGCTTEMTGSTLFVQSEEMTGCDIPEKLMHEMRSSIVFLGAIISRSNCAEITMPGGCELGPRPIDIHLSALQKLGVDIDQTGGNLSCSVKGRLKGTTINLRFPSVGATENILLASCVADGETIINNCAREPEIDDLIGFLHGAGANIRREKNGSIIVNGVSRLGSVEHTVIPDRIEAATYICAAAATYGEITLRGTNPEHISALIPPFEESGCHIKTYNDTIYVKAPEKLKSMSKMLTQPYPGFPTDAQSPMMALASVCDGTTVFVENIFTNRYKNVGELRRMGADISLEEKVAIVTGVPKLHGAKVECTDLRGGASLAVAGLAAQGTTELSKICHLERGYENFSDNLISLGADVKVEPDEDDDINV
jgi:UDP-N-acetylglucosamine 1-carboxyvinyltransferase